MEALLLILFLLPVLLGVTASFSKNVTGAANVSESVTITSLGGVTAGVSVPAAQPSTLTTRTSATAGTLTMTNTSHGVITGQRVDLFWTGGAAYGATVGTVSGTSVPFTGAVGTLPIATTVINVGICTSAPFEVIGNNVQALVLASPQNRGYIVFWDGAANNYAILVTAGNAPTWKTGDASANPLAGDTPTLVYFSHANTAGSDSSMVAVALTN